MINLKIIKRCIFFKDLTDQDFSAILRCIQARGREYKEKENIVSFGDSTNFLYIVISGIAREIKLSDDGELNIGLDYKKNQIYGLDYINTKEKIYKDNLIALTDTTVLIVDRFRFLNPCDNVCRRHIILNKLTMIEISRITNEYKKRINYMAKKKTKEKVLEYLYTLAKECKCKEFYIPYTREELAKILGVERTALSFELSKLKKEGLIDYNHNYFKVIEK